MQWCAMAPVLILNYTLLADIDSELTIESDI